MKILAHIAGLTTKYKLKLISDIEILSQQITPPILVLDLDNLTKACINSKYITSLDAKIDELQNQKLKFKRNQCKTITKEIKELEISVMEYWKTKLENILFDMNKEHNVILIGKSTFYNNHNFSIKIPTSNKLFIKLNLKDYSREMIINNLDMHREAIINGKFDLNYINLDFISRDRENIQDTYKDMGYIFKSYSDIFKLIQLFIFQINNPFNISGLFFVSTKELSKIDIKKQKNIIAYTSLWLAIISSIKTGIVKGYCNNEPYIKESKNNSLEKLNKSLYVYYTIDMNCFMPELSNASQQIYKYISTCPIVNVTSKCLENPLSMLKKMNVNIINYNNISTN